MLKVKFVKRLVMSSVAGVIAASGASTAIAAVAAQGLPPAANTYKSFGDASIARDSGLNQPLDLLNDFYPAIEINITDRDNVRRRSDVQEDDLVITANPSLAYRTNIGRHQFYAAYSGLFTFHDEFDQEDANSNALKAQLGLDLARRWDLNLFAGLGNAVEQRGVSGTRPFNQLIPGSDENGPDELDYNFYGADLIYGRKASPLVAVLGFEKYTTSYKNNSQGNSNASSSRDRRLRS